MSEQDKKSLVERYYTWEKLVLVTALLLIFWQIFGLSDATSLPLLDVKLRDPSKFPLVVSIILAVEFLFLLIEWKQSEEVARHNFVARFRFNAVLILAVAAIWINLPTLTKGTALAEVSRLWFVFYLFIGLAVGALTSVLIFATLMIRSNEETAKFPLSPIPVATRCVYMSCWPMVLILLSISYVASCHAPFAVLQVAPWITALPISYFVVEKIVSLFFCYDAEGRHIPVHQRIFKLKEIFKMHDYLYFLNKRDKQLTEKVKEIMPPNASPREQQNAFRQHYSKDSGNIMLRSRTLEEFYFETYSKDGDPNNKKPENLAVRIKLQNPKAAGLKVQTYPKDEDPPKNFREMTLKINFLEKHANDFLQKNLGKPITQQALFSYTIDRSVEDTFMEQACIGFPLHDAAFAGRQDLIEQFLTKGKNINEQAGNGWTPLLAAVAQGHPKMVKLMLERGANPDIANLQKTTPLMYAARYGNLEIAKMLLDFGAMLDLQDIYGDTALAVAVTRGQESLVRLFISKGAKIDTRNTLEKLTPLDLAHHLGHGEIARLLRKAKK